MKNLYLIFLSVFVLSICSFSSTNLTNQEQDSQESITTVEIVGDVLCVKNGGYSRKSIVLWFKGEAVSQISVAGNDKSCFEIGDYEGSYQWKASEGMKGSKKGVYGNTATFY